MDIREELKKAEETAFWYHIHLKGRGFHSGKISQKAGCYCISSKDESIEFKPEEVLEIHIYGR